MTSLSVRTTMATTLPSHVSTITLHTTTAPAETTLKGTLTFEFTYSPTVTETYLDGPPPDRPDSTVAVAVSISCIGILVLGIGCFRLRQMNKSKRASMHNTDFDNTMDSAPALVSRSSAALDLPPLSSASLESIQHYSRNMDSTVELSNLYLMDHQHSGSPPEISPPPYEKRIRPP